VGCEAALVTAGTASALTLGTAACVTGKDREKIRRIPDTAGMKSEVVLPKGHRNGYDHAVRNAGVRLVEAENAEALERAVNERTAALLFFNVHEPAGRIRADEFARLGKKLGIPTFIDIAADVPPAENLFRFHRLGYDLVAVSGGKGLRGPQCSGILMGRKDLIEAAALNNNPHTDAVCRTNKVGKEEIVGVWAALEEFLSRDPAALWKEWERRCRAIIDRLADVPGVKAEPFVPEIANAVPHVRVAWGDPAPAVSPPEVQRRLRDGEPRIEIRAATPTALELAVWTLEPGEEEVVGRRLRDAFKP
jgi:L-seryl-tRNA(Ser) seleniumtransferase